MISGEPGGDALGIDIPGCGELCRGVQQPFGDVGRKRDPHEKAERRAGIHALQDQLRFRKQRLRALAGSEGTGMEIELIWSRDETMVELNIASSNGRTHNIRMSALELEHLHQFLGEQLL